MELRVGDPWTLIQATEDPPRSSVRGVEVCVLAIEAQYVLVEHLGERDPWGHPKREWVERALFRQAGYTGAYPTPPPASPP